MQIFGNNFDMSAFERIFHTNDFLEIVSMLNVLFSPRVYVNTIVSVIRNELSTDIDLFLYEYL